MKQILRLSFAFAMLFSSGMQGSVLPYLSIRSQGINDARELVGWQTQINKAGMCKTYGSFSMTPEYTRSFNADSISQALFCDALVNNCCDRASLKIQGTEVVNRDPQALMAENFYLPTDFNSIINVEPRIDNFLIDFNMYLGLDEWQEGLFFRIHAPVVYTRWDLNYDETILNAGSNSYDPGYFTNIVTNTVTPQGFSRSFLLDSFTEYVNDGASIPQANGTTVASVAGITFDPLTSARWSRCRKTRTGVADVRMQLGYNFLLCPDHHLGLSFYAAAPTGNRPLGNFLFEPIVGNGKHWEVGIGLTSHKNIWKSEDECCSWDFYLDANLTHLCKTRQCRTFDLVGKPLSRYMLMTKMGIPVQTLFAVDQINTTTIPVTGQGFIAPFAQFQNEFQPVANISTIPVKVSAAIQSDIVLKFSWTHCNFQWDLGYNFWARSCEKICKYEGSCCYNNFPSNTWALKGDAFVYGFDGVYDPENPTTPPSNIDNQGTPLSATESQATIFSGTNNWPSGSAINSQGYVLTPGTVVPWSSNPGIDNPKFAIIDPTDPASGILSTYDEIDQTWLPVATSFEPVLIKETDLDLAAGRQRGISNKLFTHIGYTWADHHGWTPFFGIGGEVEWGHNDHNSICNDSCHHASACHQSHAALHTALHDCHDACHNNNASNGPRQNFALSQWGVWLKTGVSFN